MHAEETAGGNTAALPLPERQQGKETSATMRQRICAHFPSDRYAVFFEVRNATGFAQKRRDGYCDALVMGLWPSRGLELWGLEIKVRRADWLRELKKPEKAEEFLPYCHRWFVVAPADVIHPGELPPTWGHLAPARGGLRAVTSAPLLSPRPADVGLLASIARSAANGWTEHPSYLNARKEMERSVEQGVADGCKRQKARLFSLAERLVDFELASGVPLFDRYELREIIRDEELPAPLREKLRSAISTVGRDMTWRGPEKIGGAVRAVLDGGVDHMRKDLRAIIASAERIARDAESALREHGLIEPRPDADAGAREVGT